MAFRAARNADISVNAQIIGGYCDTIDLDITVDGIPIEVFKSNWASAISGQAHGKVTLSGAWDPAAAPGPAAVLTNIIQNDSVAVVVYPGGNTVGQRSASFNALLTSYKESSKVKDKVAFSAELVAVGTVTFATL